MEARKLVRLGSTSLVVTIPSDWARRMRLKPGSTVYVEDRGDELVIKAYGGKGAQKPASMNTAGLEDPSILGKLPLCLYILGVDNVLLTPSETLGEESIYRIRMSASRLNGVEVVEDGRGVQVRSLLDTSRIDARTALRQMSLTISKIADAAISVLRGEPVEPGVLRLNRQEIFRLQHLVIKCLISGSKSPDRRRNIVYLIAASLTGLLGDTLASIAADVVERGLDGTGREGAMLADLMVDLRNLVVGVVGALITASSKRTSENLDHIAGIKDRLRRLKKSVDSGMLYYLSKIEDSLRILEIVNNMAICNLVLDRIE